MVPVKYRTHIPYRKHWWYRGIPDTDVPGDFGYSVDDGLTQPYVPPVDCRQAPTCDVCSDDFGDVYVVPPDSPVPPPPCPTPIVSIAVTPATVRCGETATVTWSSLDVTMPGTVTVNGVQRTPNAAGLIHVGVTATTTFTIVATSACGTTATAQATVTFVSPTATISTTTPQVVCGDTVRIVFATTGLWTGAQVGVYRQLDGGAWQLLLEAAPNTSGFYDDTIYNGTVVYKIAAQDACSALETTVQVAATIPAPSLSATVAGDECGVLQLYWDGSMCGHNRQLTIAGPGFTGTEVIEALAGSRYVDPVEFAAEATQTADNNGYEFTWVVTLSTDENTLQVTVARCLPPRVSFTVTAVGTTEPVPCEDQPASFTLAWDSLFAGNGVVIYEEDCTVIHYSTDASGSVVKSFGRPVTVCCTAVETCGASCNTICNDITMEEPCQPCSCVAPDGDYVLTDDISGVLAADTNFVDCTDSYEGGDPVWDGTLSVASCAASPVGFVIRNANTEQDFQVEIIELSREQAGVPAVCWWELKFYCGGCGAEAACAVIYRKMSGLTPDGDYTLVQDPNEQWPTTLHIAPAYGAPTPPSNPCSP